MNCKLVTELTSSKQIMKAMAPIDNCGIDNQLNNKILFWMIKNLKWITVEYSMENVRIFSSDVCNKDHYLIDFDIEIYSIQVIQS